MSRPANQDVAVELGMSEGAVKVAVHRLRRRYRELLERHIEHTVETADEVAAEIRHLYASVSGRV